MAVANESLPLLLHARLRLQQQLLRGLDERTRESRHAEGHVEELPAREGRQEVQHRVEARAARHDARRCRLTSHLSDLRNLEISRFGDF